MRRNGAQTDAKVRSQNSLTSPEKRAEKFDEKSTVLGAKLTPIALETLRLITPERCTNKTLREILGLSPSAMSNRLKQLRDAELIVKDRLIYHLTQEGQKVREKLLGLGETSPEKFPVLRSHAYMIEMRIRRLPRYTFNLLRRHGFAVNYAPTYTAHKRRLYDCTIMLYSKKAIVWTGSIWEGSPEAADKAAVELAHRAKLWLEDRCAIICGSGQPDDFIIKRRHHALVDHPIAKKVTAYGEIYRSDRLHIDRSTGLPEVETVHPGYATDDARTLTDNTEWLARYKIEDYLPKSKSRWRFWKE